MGTQKRERQKANRIQRQIEEERAARVASIRRNVIRGVAIALLAIGAVVVIAWIGGAFDGDDESGAPVDAPRVTAALVAA